MEDFWQSDKLKDIFFLEEHRVASFETWPFDEKSPCSISKLAEAGFYWSGNKRDIDTVTCFVCGKVLDGWEPFDDPWKEHAKHAPQCEFVKLGKKQCDLLVDELITISGAVAKNKIQNNITQSQKKLSSLAQAAYDKFNKSS